MDNKDSKKEEWKLIPGSDNYYISSWGRVRATNFMNQGYETIVRCQVDDVGKLRLYYRNLERELESCYLCFLVARAFVPNPQEAEFVQYIDGNRSNCRADNLYWSFKRKPDEPDVYQYSNTGILIKKYESPLQIEKETGINRQQVSKCCKNGGGITHGFYWSNGKFEPPQLFGLNNKYNHCLKVEIDKTDMLIEDDGYVFVCNEVTITPSPSIKAFSSVIKDCESVDIKTPTISRNSSSVITSASLKLAGFKGKMAIAQLIRDGSNSIVEIIYPNDSTITVGAFGYYISEDIDVMRVAKWTNYLFRKIVCYYGDNIARVCIDSIKVQIKK